jgi:hypothetical protein
VLAVGNVAVVVLPALLPALPPEVVMGVRFHNARFPRWSAKATCGSPGRAVRRLFRRIIRARQRVALGRDPDGTEVREEHMLKPLSRWY